MCRKITEEEEEDEEERKSRHLAYEGSCEINVGVSPRDQPEIDDGDQSILIELRQFINYESGAVRAESFVVQSQFNFLRGRDPISSI